MGGYRAGRNDPYHSPPADCKRSRIKVFEKLVRAFACCVAPGYTQEHPEDTQEHPGAPRRHPGNTQEHPGAPRKHPGDTQETPRSTQVTPRTHPGAPRRQPRSTQGPPRKHPGAPRRHPRGTQEQPGGTQEAPRRHPSVNSTEIENLTRSAFAQQASKTKKQRF